VDNCVSPHIAPDHSACIAKHVSLGVGIKMTIDEEKQNDKVPHSMITFILNEMS